MPFKRLMTAPVGSGLPEAIRQGAGLLTNVSRVAVATDANATLSVASIAGGYVQYTGFTAGRNLTADTGANYAAAFPDMDIGDSYQFMVSITTAFAGTLVAATGTTISGRATVLANTWNILTLTKTGAATFDLNVA